MTYTTVILFATIIVPFVAPFKYKKKAMLISWGLLFFIWAFQYQMSIDWFVYINRWNGAIRGVSLEDREIEPLYKLILMSFKPLSFFGYLMACALFGIVVLKKYVDSYIATNRQWIFFLTFSIGVSYFLEFVDTNRQTLAIMFVMIAVYIESNGYLKTLKIKYWVIALMMIIAAFNIHRSAIITLPMLLFPIFIIKNINYRYLYIFIAIDVFSFFVDFSHLSLFIEMSMANETSLDGFNHYVADINERSKSFIEQGIFLLSLLLLIFHFDKFKNNEKPIILCAIIYLAFQGYAMYTMLRALSYYRIFFALAIPLLYMKFSTKNKKMRYIANGLLAFYITYMIYRYSIDINGSNVEGFKNFKTIFDAPVWQ